MGTPPLFSVIIPSFERPNDLRKCLHSLRKEVQASCHDYEIIVTDDSKSESCRNVVENEFPSVRWVQGKQNGPGGNRNAGANFAMGHWIIFIDDDCIADKGYIDAYSAAIHQNPDMVLFEGRIYPDRPKKTWAECCPENSHGNMFWTSNLCVKKKIFHIVGGFDERFRVAYEDIDFAFRIKSEGFKTKFIEQASVCHPWRTLKHEGNNWKPKGFEVSELVLFIQKHPNAKEHNSPTVYLRHLMRMVTSDFFKCIFQFKCKGISTLLSQILTTMKSVRVTLKLKLKV